jgi:hypothetical protein
LQEVNVKPFLLACALCLCLAANGMAQATGADSPATKEDVERYLQAIHSHDTMQGMIGAMSKPMQQMIHEQYLKDKDNLPADFEARMNKMVDDLWKGMPFDEMIAAMVPTYQKHFTKGDIDAFVAFYSSAAGQKLLRELPQVTTESMQVMMPIVQQHLAAMNQRIQQEVADIKAAQLKSRQEPAAPQK